MSSSSSTFATSSAGKIRRNRCIGLLLGLCAGDRNGGPQRMAMRIAESLVVVSPSTTAATTTVPNSSTEQPHQHSPPPTVHHGAFNRLSVIHRYQSWFQPLSKEAEPERAFDTGNVFFSVFYQALASRTTFNDNGNQCSSSSSTPLPSSCQFVTEQQVDAAAQRVYEQTKSAGANPCHRNSVLSMAHFLGMSALVDAARRETTITHAHPEAVDTAIAVNVICRRLIAEEHEQQQLKATVRLAEAVSFAKQFVKEELVLAILNDFPFTKPPQHHTGGHSPLVLGVALFFLQDAASFEEALNASIVFAGPANFAPVLVGSIGGALFGVEDSCLKKISEFCGCENKKSTTTSDESEEDEEEVGVTFPTLQHRHALKPAHLKRIVNVAEALASTWPQN